MISEEITDMLPENKNRILQGGKNIVQQRNTKERDNKGDGAHGIETKQNIKILTGKTNVTKSPHEERMTVLIQGAIKKIKKVISQGGKNNDRQGSTMQQQKEGNGTHGLEANENIAEPTWKTNGTLKSHYEERMEALIQVAINTKTESFSPLIVKEKFDIKEGFPDELVSHLAVLVQGSALPLSL